MCACVCFVVVVVVVVVVLFFVSHALVNRQLSFLFFLLVTN